MEYAEEEKTKAPTETLKKKWRNFEDFTGGQWLRLHAPYAGGLGSIPGQGTRSHMLHVTKDPTHRN